MRRVSLDTSAYSHFMRHRREVVEAVRAADEIRLSPIVLGELHSGFRHGNQQVQNEAELREFLASPRVRIIGVDEQTADCYAAIYVALRRAGKPIPTHDIWIAASAMQHGLVVLTTDAHFDHIPQVRIRRFEP